MTLNWSKTAPDCRVNENLYPLISGLIKINDARLWEFTPEGRFRYGKTRPTQVIDDIIWDWSETIPDTGYWGRTRRRLRTRNGVYLTRYSLALHVRALQNGYTCQCRRQVCDYPQSP